MANYKKSILISDEVHKLLKDYCDKKSYKISKWLEEMIKQHIIS